jgi:MFS family permease
MNGRIYRGWWVVAVVTAVLAVSSGARFLYGVVLKPVSEEFGWSRTDLAAVVTINVIMISILQPIVGILVDRWGSRPLILLGIIGTGLMALPITLATELWQIYIIYSLVASIAFAAMSPVNITKLVAGWFTKRRGLALSISTSGAAVGQLAIIPIATWVMLRYGWRMSYWTLAGAAVLAMLPLAWWLLRDAPPGATDDPDGTEDKAVSAAQAAPAAPVRVWQSLRSLPYWQLSFGFFVCGYTMAFTQVHMIPYILDMPEHAGMAMQTVASTALAVVGGGSVLGALLIGSLSDRVGIKHMLTLTYFLRGLSYVLLLLAGTNEAGIFFAAIVMGISWTSTTPLTSALTADIYGRASLGTIFACIFTAMNVGVGLGSYVAGLDYDITGNYHVSLLANGFLGFAAAAIVQAVRVRPFIPVAPPPAAPIGSPAYGGD